MYEKNMTNKVVFCASENFNIFPKIGIWGGGGLPFLKNLKR